MILKSWILIDHEYYLSGEPEAHDLGLLCLKYGLLCAAVGYLAFQVLLLLAIAVPILAVPAPFPQSSRKWNT